MEFTLLDEKEVIKIQELISPLLGMPAMNVFSGIDSLFIIQFGDLEIKNGRIHSEWHMFFQYVHWEIHYQGKTHVTSADSRLKILDLIGILEGKTLLEVEFILPEYKTVLHFDFETQVHIINFESSDPADAELNIDGWAIFMPAGRYIDFRPGIYWKLAESELN